MKRIVLLFMTVLIHLPVSASHTWTGIDLCEVYKDKLPPGLTLESLPEGHSPGAVLLNQYCTQCHNLPGPNRHSAAEWSEVTAKMFMLMEVSSRFGGLMGRVESMQPQEQERLLAYLQRYAAPLTGDRGQSQTTHHNGSNLTISSGMTPTPTASEANSHLWLTRSLALLIFLLLTGLGLLRWWRNSRTDHKSCITE